MAMFGLPGGGELLVIAIVLFMLFVPGALMFAIGFFAGKKAGAVRNAVVPDAKPSVGTEEATQEVLPDE